MELKSDQTMGKTLDVTQKQVPEGTRVNRSRDSGRECSVHSKSPNTHTTTKTEAILTRQENHSSLISDEPEVGN